MGTIVCATRGGEASRRTQEQAVDLAQERDADLIFLCAVDPGFAGPMDDDLATALVDELKRLGRSLLGIAQARAQERGVEAETAVCRGPVRQSIAEYLRKVDADTLVLGAPVTESTAHALGSGDVHQLAETIRQSTGVEVIVVDDSDDSDDLSSS